MEEFAVRRKLPTSQCVHDEAIFFLKCVHDEARRVSTTTHKWGYGYSQGPTTHGGGGGGGGGVKNEKKIVELNCYEPIFRHCRP